MKHLIVIIILIFCSSFNLYGQEEEQEEVDLSKWEKEIEEGNKSKFFNYYFKMTLNEEFNYQEQNKSSLLNKDGLITNHIDYFNRGIIDIDTKLFFGKHFDFNVRNFGVWTWNEDEDCKDSDVENWLQECYLVTRISDFLIVDVGRENVITGVGFGWNPTDYMLNASLASNQLDTRNIREERLGAYMAKASIFFDAGQIMGLYSPEIDEKKFDTDGTNDHNRSLLKFSCNYIPNSQVDLLYFNGKHNSLGLNLETEVFDELIFQFESSLTKGSDIKTVEIMDDYFVDYNFQKRNQDDYYAKVVIGLNYTFVDLHNLILEYYYNSEGYSKNEWDNYFSMLKYSNKQYSANPSYNNPYMGYIADGSDLYDPTQMSRHYLHLRLSKLNFLVDNLEYSLFAIMNLYDYSSIINLDFKYSFWDSVSLSVTGTCFAGKEESEFGLSSDDFSITGKLRYFF